MFLCVILVFFIPFNKLSGYFWVICWVISYMFVKGVMNMRLFDRFLENLVVLFMLLCLISGCDRLICG